MSLIWSCPDCWTDLRDDGWDLYCEKCDRLVSWLEFAADLDPWDERSDFRGYQDVNADGK